MGFVRHLSVRVPWHDRAWDGHICDSPLENSSCLALRAISKDRKDNQEKNYAGVAFDKLSSELVPPCRKANAAFLNSKEQLFENLMPYSEWSSSHKHFLPLEMRIPSWGSLIVPYRWMLKESGFQIAEELGINATLDREPKDPDWLQKTAWIQGHSNQKILLEAFSGPLKEEESLILFYTPRTPLCDDERRVFLGAALLQEKHDIKEYPRSPGKNNDLRCMAWERAVQHSLRPSKHGFQGGFILPYHAVLKESIRNPSLNPSDYVVFAPDDAQAQFSFGSEQVTHGIAATTLLSAREVLKRTANILEGPWAEYDTWIDERLSKLWNLQGPAPGLGVVLSAFGKNFNGTLFANALSDELEANLDPWITVNEIFLGNRNPPKRSPEITKMLRKRWEYMIKKPSQFDFLKLLARMELTKDQAERSLQMDNEEILSNPYLLFEKDRTQADPISFGVVDRGIRLGENLAYELPEKCNSDLREEDNPYRIRSACVEILERNAAKGHTVLPAEEFKKSNQDIFLGQNIPVDEDVLDILRDEFEPVISVNGTNPNMFLQLERYVMIAKMLRESIIQRLENKPKKENIEWRKLIDKEFGKFNEGDIDEIRARNEKSTALSHLVENRVCALIGAAGTGKTSILKLLLGQKNIVGNRVRLLAPTGKSRVRLGEETERREDVQTIAQFLLRYERFDPITGRYFIDLRSNKVTTEDTTCVIDEASMLTEDMLASIVNVLPLNCRLILVGDLYQLPPIGAGCPFVDIVRYLQNEKNSEGVVELTIPRRQTENKRKMTKVNGSPLARADVQLAAVFSGRKLPPGEDEIIVNAIENLDEDSVKYRRWENSTDLATLIKEVILKELECTENELVSVFEKSLGAKENEKGYLEFDQGCSNEVENWQILSANRNGPHGCIYLNREIKERLRDERSNRAIKSNRQPQYKDWFRFTAPRGPEQIVYGDKVICVRNHFRKPWLYSEHAEGDKEFLANGEIGMVIGQKGKQKRNPYYTHVELAKRNDRNFSFSPKDFSDDGYPYLELAYALTVHKAQGSEFENVILVLPSDGRLISREMLYTALTRQKRRIWILHQGPFEKFLHLRQDIFSDIAGRFTNLFGMPNREKILQHEDLPDGIIGRRSEFLQERLIHRTFRGEMVRSKNELVIANILYDLEKAGYLNYKVEPRLPFDDGRGRWADFEIRSNDKTWYWEHCGMLDDENYRDRWERKKKLYANNGFSIFSNENMSGRLIVTENNLAQGLDSRKIRNFANDLFGK